MKSQLNRGFVTYPILCDGNPVNLFFTQSRNRTLGVVLTPCLPSDLESLIVQLFRNNRNLNFQVPLPRNPLLPAMEC